MRKGTLSKEAVLSRVGMGPSGLMTSRSPLRTSREETGSSPSIQDWERTQYAAARPLPPVPTRCARVFTSAAAGVSEEMSTARSEGSPPIGWTTSQSCKLLVSQAALAPVRLRIIEHGLPPSGRPQWNSIACAACDGARTSRNDPYSVAEGLVSLLGRQDVDHGTAPELLAQEPSTLGYTSPRPEALTRHGAPTPTGKPHSGCGREFPNSQEYELDPVGPDCASCPDIALDWRRGRRGRRRRRWRRRRWQRWRGRWRRRRWRRRRRWASPRSEETKDLVRGRRINPAGSRSARPVRTSSGRAVAGLEPRCACVRCHGPVPPEPLRVSASIGQVRLDEEPIRSRADDRRRSEGNHEIRAVRIPKVQPGNEVVTRRQVAATVGGEVDVCGGRSGRRIAFVNALNLDAVDGPRLSTRDHKVICGPGVEVVESGLEVLRRGPVSCRRVVVLAVENFLRKS
jgi:hypothetical protein